MRVNQAFLLCAVLSSALFGQDKVLTDAIDNFKKTADEARKANPLLAVGTGEGLSGVLKNFGSRGNKGTGPAVIELPKEQQEESERRRKARERAEQLAKAGPRRAAPAPRPVESTLPPITPIAMLAIFHPVPQPLFTLVSVDDLAKIRAGQPRAEVLSALGKPSSIAAIHGLEEGSREVLTYHLTPQQTVAIRLQDGLVATINQK